MATFGGIKGSDIQPVVLAYASTAAPSSASPAWISLKNVQGLRIMVSGTNGTTVTGSAIALSQATAVAGTGAKTLPFARVMANLDTATNGQPNFVNTVVASNTFTTAATNSVSFVYIIDVDPADLDTNAGFDAVRATVGNGTNTNIQVTYHPIMAYGGNATAYPRVTVD